MVTDQLLPRHWADLIAGRIGILRLPNFVLKERRKSSLGALTNSCFPPYDPMEEFGGVDPLSRSQIQEDYLAGSSPDEPPVSRRLGHTLYEHTARGTAEQYFAQAGRLDMLRREVFAPAGDVIDDVLDLVRSVTGRRASIATDPGYGRYFAGVIREVHGRSRLHSDDSREETPDFEVGSLPYQLGLYVFLDMPACGGALTLYEREYRPEDRPYRQGYGLDPRAVAGDSFVGVVPRAGDLILFPARHIHRVDACSGSGRRIMLQAHLGVDETGDVICWS
jgi:hypothetical protein